MSLGTWHFPLGLISQILRRRCFLPACKLTGDEKHRPRHNTQGNHDTVCRRMKTVLASLPGSSSSSASVAADDEGAREALLGIAFSLSLLVASLEEEEGLADARQAELGGEAVEGRLGVVSTLPCVINFSIFSNWATKASFACTQLVEKCSHAITHAVNDCVYSCCELPFVAPRCSSHVSSSLLLSLWLWDCLWETNRRIARAR